MQAPTAPTQTAPNDDLERAAYAACGDWLAAHETAISFEAVADRWPDACEEIARRWHGYCEIGGPRYAAEMAAKALPRLLDIDGDDAPSPDCATGEHWPADALRPQRDRFDVTALRLEALEELSAQRAARERADSRLRQLTGECRRLGITSRDVAARLRVSDVAVRKSAAWKAAAEPDADAAA